jgi:hypothetical protein
LSRKFDWLTLHGVILNISWSFFGFFMILSQRLMRPYWKINAYIHAILGTVICLLTISMALLALIKLDWTIIDANHTYFGLAVLGGVIAVSLGGMLSQYYKSYLEWQP